MTALELFAGCGGSALGLHRAGFEHLACVERNPSATSTLRAAGLPAIEADIATLDASAWRGRVDLLWASPPCQPGSTAGARLGPRDDRDGWPATLAVIDGCGPTWFLAENVLGWTYHSDHGDALRCPACHLGRVVDELGLRYPFTGTWRVDAADHGVPQRRRRVLLWAGPLPLHPDGPPPTHAHADTAAAALGLRPWVTLGEAIGATLNRASCDRRACYPCDEEHGRACGELWRMGAPAPTVTTMDEKGTRANAVAGWTFNGGPDRASDAAFLVAGIRRIDIAERLRLQGFPADWPLQGTVHDRYVQVGNAVPPALAEAAGRVVAVGHRAWTALRQAGVDANALTATLRRHRATVPAHLGRTP